jgi:dihydrolipoamide dehydrogenase
LLHVAKLINEAEEAKKWGVEFGEPKIDINKLRDFKNGVVNKLTGGLGQLAKQRKVNYINGRATFVNSTTLSIAKADGSTEELIYDKAILATGSVPAKVPGLSIDSPRVMDSTSALELSSVPKKLLVIGGGYIGNSLYVNGADAAGGNARVYKVNMASGGTTPVSPSSAPLTISMNKTPAEEPSVPLGGMPVPASSAVGLALAIALLVVAAVMANQRRKMANG